MSDAKRDWPSTGAMVLFGLVSRLFIGAVLVFCWPANEDAGQLALDGAATEAKIEASRTKTRAFRFVVTNRTIAVFYGYAQPERNWEACQEAATHEVNGFCEELR